MITLYFWEIYHLLESKNYFIDREDLLKILSLDENPQLNHIVYNPYDNSYDMWDVDGHHFHFSVLLYKDIQSKEKILKK